MRRELQGSAGLPPLILDLNFWHRSFLIIVDHFPLFEFPWILHAVKLIIINVCIKASYSFMLCSFGTYTEASAPAVLSLHKLEFACHKYEHISNLLQYSIPFVGQSSSQLPADEYRGYCVQRQWADQIPPPLPEVRDGVGGRQRGRGQELGRLHQKWWVCVARGVACMSGSDHNCNFCSKCMQLNGYCDRLLHPFGSFLASSQYWRVIES